MIGDEEPFDVLVVGAGPAGLGVGIPHDRRSNSHGRLLSRCAVTLFGHSTHHRERIFMEANQRATC